MYYDILNRLCVDHECDVQTDRRTDRRTGWLLAIAPSNTDALRTGSRQ